MRVTLAVAAACVAASALALAGVVLSHPLLSWMVHVDARHLVVNVITWTSFGAWLERRAGWRRMLLWVAAGLGTSLVAHAQMFPSHGTLYGLSAVAFFVFTAGMVACALDRWWGWAMLAGVAGVLAYEWMSGGTSAAESLVGYGPGGSARILDSGIGTTPVTGVHVACAVTGVVFGWLGKKVASRDCRRSAAAIPA